jgi:hypothetical protein
MTRTMIMVFISQFPKLRNVSHQLYASISVAFFASYPSSVLFLLPAV